MDERREITPLKVIQRNVISTRRRRGPANDEILRGVYPRAKQRAQNDGDARHEVAL